MPMSSGGYAANSSGCATRPKAREIGSTEYAGPTQHSLLIGCYVMAMAEHREPCDSRGSCTVLGAPGGEIPPGDSTTPEIPQSPRSGSFTPPTRRSGDCINRLFCAVGRYSASQTAGQKPPVFGQLGEVFRSTKVRRPSNGSIGEPSRKA